MWKHKKTAQNNSVQSWTSTGDGGANRAFTVSENSIFINKLFKFYVLVKFAPGSFHPMEFGHDETSMGTIHARKSYSSI